MHGLPWAEGEGNPEELPLPCDPILFLAGHMGIKLAPRVCVSLQGTVVPFRVVSLATLLRLSG